MASLDKRNFDCVVYVFMQIKLMFDYKFQGKRKINMFMKTRNSKREEKKKISSEYSGGCCLGESTSSMANSRLASCKFDMLGLDRFHHGIPVLRDWRWGSPLFPRSTPPNTAHSTLLFCLNPPCLLASSLLPSLPAPSPKQHSRMLLWPEHLLSYPA